MHDEGPATLHEIRQKCKDAIHNVYEGHSKEYISNVVETLVDYRLVESVDEIHIGKYVRWIKGQGDLYLGGVVVRVDHDDSCIEEIKIESIGGHLDRVIVFNKYAHRWFQFHFEECITFQKLSRQEKLIIFANESIHS